MFKFEINTRRLINGTLSFLALAAIIALFFAYRSHAQHLIPHNVPASLSHLPYYAFCSFYRMLAAYIIALIFSIIYGMAAARGGLYERILIPAIDIAQSVPVVGFFPAAVYFFVALAHGSRLGVEMAAVFLIFTSQAWNMALGVYEAVKTIPEDSKDALDSFGGRGWLKFKRLLLPASVPKLVYNSILSWVAGWYFLIACEIITVGPASYRLPGLGSFLWEAAEKGRTFDLATGLLTLLAIIVAMDMIVWQPLSTWAEKFKYEFAASSTAAQSLGMFDALAGVGPAVTRALRAVLVPPYQSDRPRDRGFAERPAAYARTKQARRRGRANADNRLHRDLHAVGAGQRLLRIGQDAVTAVAVRREADSGSDRALDHSHDDRLRDLAGVDSALRAGGERERPLQPHPLADCGNRRLDAGDGAVPDHRHLRDRVHRRHESRLDPARSSPACNGTCCSICSPASTRCPRI